MYRIDFKDASFCDGGCDGLIDTGFQLISGPTVEVRKIQELIGAKHTSGGEVSCLFKRHVQYS